MWIADIKRNAELCCVNKMGLFYKIFIDRKSMRQKSNFIRCEQPFLEKHTSYSKHWYDFGFINSTN